MRNDYPIAGEGDHALEMPTDFERAEFYSRDGYRVSFHGDNWKLNKDVNIPVASISVFLNGALERNFRVVLSEYAKSYSAHTVQNLFYSSKRYLKNTVGMEPLSVESFVSYRSTLSRDNGQSLSVVRGFIRKWVLLGYSEVPDNTIKILDQWVLKGNPKGNRVQSMCPNKGPLTDIELQGVLGALLDAYAAGRLDLMRFCCAMLVMMTGRRPSQVAALKFKDVFCDGDRYWIDFPRAKQVGVPWRSKSNRFRITEDIWLIIQEQMSSVVEYFDALIGRPITDDESDELPIFPANLKSLTSDELEMRLNGDYLHVSVGVIQRCVNSVSRMLKIVSERTGSLMHLNSTRFRYTLGTNLAREGRGIQIIAEALDHSDTQNAGVYVKNIPDIVKRLDKAVALQLAPIAQAFRGVLINSEAEARRGNDPSSRISNGRANVGNCGSFGFCGALAPIACYTCAHFQPWIDGAHEEVLDRLIEERDRVAEQTGDFKVATANDRLILAVGDVIQRCKLAKEGMANG